MVRSLLLPLALVAALFAWDAKADPGCTAGTSCSAGTTVQPQVAARPAQAASSNSADRAAAPATDDDWMRMRGSTHADSEALNDTFKRMRG
jgi:hypothetical protein